MANRLNIIITGSAGGLGNLIAEYLYKSKYNIIGIDLLPIEEINLTEYYLNEYYQYDLSDVAKIPKLIERIINEKKRIDILINNASVRQFKNFDLFTFEELDKYIKVNIQAIYYLTSAVLPFMKSNNFGRIINISSISAYNGYRTGSLYCSTKMSLITFAEAFSRELDEGRNNITINTICPDSFRKISGEKLKAFEQITKIIIKRINSIIDSDVNGRVYNGFTLRNRLLFFSLYMKKSLNFLR